MNKAAVTALLEKAKKCPCSSIDWSTLLTEFETLAADAAPAIVDELVSLISGLLTPATTAEFQAKLRSLKH